MMLPSICTRGWVTLCIDELLVTIQGKKMHWVSFLCIAYSRYAQGTPKRCGGEICNTTRPPSFT